jgi:hypothetical protein
MNVQRAGDDYSVYIFHVEQTAVIVEGLNAGHFAFRLVTATAVDVGHGYEFNSVDTSHLPQQVVAAIAHANHSHAHAIVRAEHGRSWIRQHGGCS